jgi:pimeloyl-ACP methyl ester carboxylesterase
LDVLARLCDEKLGHVRDDTPPPLIAKPLSATLEPFHFGTDGALYGVLTKPTGPSLETAVLVCGPVGQEKARAHFVLQALARRLAASGIATLAFDYFGTGDSLGESAEATCTRWQRDVAEAREELVRRTGAKRIVAVGVRLGAPLLWNASRNFDVQGLVLWDPVFDGVDYVAQTTEIHARLLSAREHFSFRKNGPLATATELFGRSHRGARRARDPAGAARVRHCDVARLVPRDVLAVRNGRSPGVRRRDHDALDGLSLDRSWPSRRRSA